MSEWVYAVTLTYNGEGFLRQQIESILKQSYINIGLLAKGAHAYLFGLLVKLMN